MYSVGNCFHIIFDLLQHQIEYGSVLLHCSPRRAPVSSADKFHMGARVHKNKNPIESNLIQRLFPMGLIFPNIFGHILIKYMIPNHKSISTVVSSEVKRIADITSAVDCLVRSLSAGSLRRSIQNQRLHFPLRSRYKLT